MILKIQACGKPGHCFKEEWGKRQPRLPYSRGAPVLVPPTERHGRYRSLVLQRPLASSGLHWPRLADSWLLSWAVLAPASIFRVADLSDLILNDRGSFSCVPANLRIGSPSPSSYSAYNLSLIGLPDFGSA